MAEPLAAVNPVTAEDFTALALDLISAPAATPEIETTNLARAQVYALLAIAARVSDA